MLVDNVSKLARGRQKESVGMKEQQPYAAS